MDQLSVPDSAIYPPKGRADHRDALLPIRRWFDECRTDRPVRPEGKGEKDRLRPGPDSGRAGQRRGCGEGGEDRRGGPQVYRGVRKYRSDALTQKRRPGGGILYRPGRFAFWGSIGPERILDDGVRVTDDETWDLVKKGR